ncbi:MAG: aldo/keto reductase [Corynebacteriales bacterium]|nr:aldo/keto reductase [Mycobacteriales bacterium]
MPSSTFFIGGDRRVRRLGFGAMRLATSPESAREASITVARHAVERGINLIDTAHLYGWGANEELLADALHPYPEDLLITTKIGITRSSGADEMSINGRPEVLHAQIDRALTRLKVDSIELLQLHRIDSDIPLSDQMGALRQAQEAGKVAKIGLSEVTVDQLAQARQTVEIASVQNRYSMFDRTHEPVLEACEAAAIAFLPWRPVAEASGAHADITALASELGATNTQLSLAWLLHRSPVILPIPGTSSIAHLDENVAAADLRLSAETLERIERLISS